MTTATQPRVSEPDTRWIHSNFFDLHDNCWVLNKPKEGESLIVLAPNFGHTPINLGCITLVERSEGKSFWVRTIDFPAVKDRYELSMKVHLVAEAIL